MLHQALQRHLSLFAALDHHTRAAALQCAIRAMGTTTTTTGSSNGVSPATKTSGHSNLEEAAQAASGPRVDASPQLLERLKDKGLLHTAGYIDGKWTSSPGKGSTFQVANPATGQAIATLPLMKANETRAAIAAAHAVFPSWKQQTAKERAAILKKWHALILQHQEDIATIMTMECGKPRAESLAEIASGAASVEWFAEECKRVTGDIFETGSRDRRMITIKQPVGVVGAITPWNFPMSMITRKVAPALAAGCTVVLKPSEQTPLTALALTELAERAGLPDGCLNIVIGDSAAIGQELTSNETVRKIGFTGSTPVGKMLMAAAAATVKRVSLELGGNAPLIVFKDADLEQAATACVASALRNAGQTCICTNRVFVQDSIHDKFAELLAARVRKLKVGDGLEQGINMGPLINAKGLDKVVQHVTDAVSKGAKVIEGGNKPQLAAPFDGGFFYEPTVISNATIDMRLFKEETFGPLIPLFKFSTDREAIQLANNTEYGLAAYFFTKDLGRAWHVAEELEFGMVGLNETAITSEVAPFGGIKQSGLGREQSKYGLAEFLDIKYVCMGIGYSSGSSFQ